MPDFIERISQQDLHRNLHQQQIDNLLIRLDLLKPQDRLMLEFHYRKNASFKQIASITGKKPQSIARYIGSVTKRLLSQNYIMFLRYSNCFKTRDLEIAYDKFLLGLGYRKIAARQNLTDKQARLKIEKLTSWLNRQIRSARRKDSRMNTNNPPVDFNHPQAKNQIDNCSYINHSDFNGTMFTGFQRTIQNRKFRNTHRLSGNSFFGVTDSLPPAMELNAEAVKTDAKTFKTGKDSVKTGTKTVGVGTKSVKAGTVSWEAGKEIVKAETVSEKIDEETVKAGTELEKTGAGCREAVSEKVRLDGKDRHKAESGNSDTETVKTGTAWREAVSEKVRLDGKNSQHETNLPRFTPEMRSFDPQMHPNAPEMHRI